MDDEKTPPDDEESTVTAPSPSVTPGRIGPYKILQKLGEGGMGVVYLAEQEHPIRRRVALKIIKLGMDTKAVIARFEAERQALALMNHPNVAKVFDAGTTDQGRPYFVMEYVKGVPITEHCDRQRLTTKERLKIFTQVCEGVQHAHQTAIIHRDLKPSNVLVTIQDEKPVPKIIDFGVAKAIEHRLTERTLFTELGQVVGTPEYMSPEQAEMTQQDIDTRTDVYSLGVILYQLLVGALPVDPKELRRAGFDEIRRRIREEEPSRPSTRVTNLRDASTESAKRRRTDPASLARQLRGDLDWITMKALEKDRTRRYGSPQEMAADIERHFASEPVLAGPPGARYRLGKFVRRHLVGLLGIAATVVIAILVGVALQQGFGRTEANARRLVADAELHLREGTYRDGLAKVNEALELTPDSMEVKKTKARLLRELRHDRELANLAQEILASHPDDWEAHAWLASAGRYGGLADIPAQEHVEAVERLAPHTAEAWRLKGLMAASKLEAVECFDRALELDPAHYWALIGRAEAYIELKKFPEAVADAERAIVARPRSPRGRCLLAKIHADGFHDSEAALAEYEKAIAIDPEDPITYLDRSSVHERLEKFDELLKDTTRASELEQKRRSSHNSVTLARRAAALDYLGRYEEGLADARSAVEIEPHLPDGYDPLIDALSYLEKIDELRTAVKELKGRAEAWADRKAAARILRWISVIHFNLGEEDEGIAIANQVIELDPEEVPLNFAVRGWMRKYQEGPAALEADCDLMALLAPKEPEPLRFRGELLWRDCDRVDAALADYARAIEMAPAWADIYSERGRILRAELRYAEALADHGKSLELAPKWAEGFLRRASVYEDLERWPDVVSDLERYFALGGANADARWSYALALAHLDREGEALAVLDTAIQKDPRNADGYLSRANLLFKLGRLDEALAEIHKAVDVDPKSEWGYLTRAWYLAYTPHSCAQIDDDLSTVREMELSEAWPKSLASLKIQEVMVRIFALRLACPRLVQPAQSLEIARKFDMKYSEYQRNLGATLYANERHEEASVALLKALELQPRPDPSTLFFLAMTEAKLGRQDDAHRTYDRAVSRMNETWPRSPEYLLVQEEAAQLLGIQP